MSELSKQDYSLVLDEADYQKLLSILKNYSVVDAHNAVRKGLTEGATYLKNKGKSNLSNKLLHHGSKGHLLKSMSVQTIKKSAKSYAGFKRSSKKGQGGGNHAHLVDRGTKPRYTKKGWYRGVMPKNNFWTETVTNSGKEAIGKVLDGIYKSLEDITNKKS